MSNNIQGVVQTLEVYHNKDVEGKAFENLKKRSNRRQVAVTSKRSRSLVGKLFVLLVAVIYFIYITN